VIRDTPKVRSATFTCIERAVARRRDPGRACSVARRGALDPDAAVLAARRMRARRVQVVDLTHFFCGSRRCYPVVGGALVYRDGHHLTETFVGTLGPYMHRRISRLMASW
jgi:hypothetical protein